MYCSEGTTPPCSEEWRRITLPVHQSHFAGGTMRRFALITLFIFIVAVGAWAAGEVQPVSESYARIPSLDDVVEVPANAPTYTPGFGELDEIVGDTVHVGWTYWEAQHNGTVGRMIGYHPEMNWADGTTDPGVTMVWTALEGADGGSTRHVRFNRVRINDDGTYTVEQDQGYVVDNGTRAGYTTLGFDSETALAFPAYHSSPVGSDAYETAIAAEWAGVIPGLFNQTDVSRWNNSPTDVIWPKAVYTQADGVGYLHTVSSESREDNSAEMAITYGRSEYDPGTFNFIDNGQELVTDHGMNIAADIAASNDGSKIAIAQTVSIDYLYFPEDDPSQANNDIWLWVSEDEGETWDWDNPTDVTHFIHPDLDLLPDTTLAEQDTFRAYTDVNVYFDQNDDLHLAWSNHMWWQLRELWTPASSWLYHWSDVDEMYTLMVDGSWQGNVTPGSWQHNVQRPSFYHDPDTGILWCVFMRYGMEDDVDPADSTYNDISDDGFPNADIFVTASPPNSGFGEWYGHMWTRPVNITNTRGLGQAIVAGECQSEREPNVALESDGEYLHIEYVLDLDAGFTVQDEGEFTQNPVVYHRVAKTDIIDLFNSNAILYPDYDPWVVNHPIHVDGNGFWEDEYNWAWNGTDEDPTPWPEDAAFFRGFSSVENVSGTTPATFALHQNFPNPFNPTTRISYTLETSGFVSLKVFDVLGREVATLTSTNMHTGTHNVTFDGSELASGVYFLKLSQGKQTQVQKMMLMK